jgi:hypothetical protein
MQLPADARPLAFLRGDQASGKIADLAVTGLQDRLALAQRHIGAPGLRNVTHQRQDVIVVAAHQSRFVIPWAAWHRQLVVDDDWL